MKAGPLLPLALLLALAVAVLILFEARTMAWMRLQEGYRTAETTFRTGVRDKVVAHAAPGVFGKKEYCVTCHLGMAGFRPRDGTVFGSHPDVFHEVIELDCVVCHKGDPDSLRTCKDTRYGFDRPLAGRYAWTSCLHCHDPGRWPDDRAGFAAAVQARDEVDAIVKRFGCLGCHQLAERGGRIGPSLTLLGRETVSDLDGRFATVFDRVEEKIRDSRASNPGSIMPVTRLEPASSRLIASYLSLNGVALDTSARWSVGGGTGASPSGEELYGYFCSGCHNHRGEGRERGADGAQGVPTLSSKLLAHYADPAHLTKVIALGRPGTLMEGFRREEGDDRNGPRRSVLSARELEGVARFVASGAFAEYGDGYREVAVASCAVCHVRRQQLYDSMTPDGRASYFRKHPVSYPVEKLCETERLECPPAPEAIRRGRELFGALCAHCHDSAATGEASAREISAPRIDGYFRAPEFSDAFFLMNVVCGRGDGARNKWRHVGILRREWTILELVAILYAVRSRP